MISSLVEISKSHMSVEVSKRILPKRVYQELGGGLHRFGYKPGIVGRAAGRESAEFTRWVPNKRYTGSQPGFTKTPPWSGGYVDQAGLTGKEVLSGKQQAESLSREAREARRAAKRAARGAR